MKKQVIKTAISVAAIAIGMAAYAAPTLFITDGVTTVGPITGANGSVTYTSGSFDASWSVVITAGITKPLNGSAVSPNMELTIQANSLGSANNLSVTFSDTDFGPVPGSFSALFNGQAIASPGGTIAFNTYYDASNRAAALTTPLTASGNLGGPIYSDFVQVGSISSASFSLSEVVTITATPAATYSLAANLQSLSLACAGGSGPVGANYSSTLVASGGVSPYTFAIISGSLPPGLTLNATTGTISGIPTQAGTFPYVAQVTDDVGRKANTAGENCGITITGCTGSICGTVVKDTNCDGKLAGEPGISGITVTLDNTNGTVVATTTTDANGNYCFYGLAQGTYTVVVTPPANCHQTKGCTISCWKDSHGRTCWTDWDNTVHWKNSDGTHCWLDNNCLAHWNDRCGNAHWQCLDTSLCHDVCATETCQDCNGVSNQRQVCLQACQNKVLDAFGYATCSQWNYCQPKNCYWNCYTWNNCYWNYSKLDCWSW